MGAQNRKLTLMTLDIGGTEFQIQCKAWTMNNGTGDATIFYTYAPEGTFAEAAEDSYSLELSFYSDWRSGGISDYLWVHDGETVPFQLDHQPLIVGEHVRWTGDLLIKAPKTSGGEVRTTEVTDSTLVILGKPVYSRP